MTGEYEVPPYGPITAKRIESLRVVAQDIVDQFWARYFVSKHPTDPVLREKRIRWQMDFIARHHFGWPMDQ